MTLSSRTRQTTLLRDLEIAESFFARGRGLLGRASLGPEQGLWIRPCNNIHTWFMKFPIDCVFVDRGLTVRSLREHVQPWRMVMPQWKAHSVIEMPAGSISRLGIRVGEVLDVGA